METETGPNHPTSHEPDKGDDNKTNMASFKEASANPVPTETVLRKRMQQ
jgi:hypothetical protein